MEHVRTFTNVKSEGATDLYWLLLDNKEDKTKSVSLLCKFIDSRVECLNNLTGYTYNIYTGYIYIYTSYIY